MDTIPHLPIIQQPDSNNRTGRIFSLKQPVAYVGDYLDNIDAPEFIPAGSMVQVSGYRMSSCARRRAE